jgi:hypothetical protein
MTLTKEQVLENLDEVKKFIQEAEKDEEKVVGLAIRNRSGKVIFQSTKTTYKEAIVEKGGADLYGVYLSGADLIGADLYGAYLSGAELANAKFYGRWGTKQLKRSQLPDFLGALGFVIVD